VEIEAHSFLTPLVDESVCTESKMCFTILYKSLRNIVGSDKHLELMVGKETFKVFVSSFSYYYYYFNLKLKVGKISVNGIHNKFRETPVYLFSNCYKQILTDRHGDASILLETFVARALEICTKN